MAMKPVKPGLEETREEQIRINSSSKKVKNVREDLDTQRVKYSRPRRACARYQPSSSTAGIRIGIDHGFAAPVKKHPFIPKKLKLRRANGHMLDGFIANYDPTSDKPFGVIYRFGEVEEEHEWLSLKDVSDNDIEWDGDPLEIP